MSVFQVQNALKVVLFLGLFLYYFLAISDSTFWRLGPSNRGCRMEGIATIDFAKIAFNEFRDGLFFFGSLQSCFF